MVDWRQIQGRIRKAKAGPDPLTALTQIFEKTRDAMAAFELGRLLEKSGKNEEAVSWYTAAWQRFRRAQWRTKAAEALERLGAPVPTAALELTAPAVEAEEAQPQLQLDLAAAAGPAESAEPADAAEEQSGEPGVAGEVADAGPKKRRRRGRRGGRRRHKGERTEPQAPPKAEAAPAPPMRVSPAAPARPREERPRRVVPETRPEPPAQETEVHAVGSAWAAARGRAGDPAMASRMAQLESHLRRLMGSTLHRMDEIEHAPAGPGVFLISDSDQITHYYVEACRTLRIAIGNVVRSGRGASGPLRERLAEHLGISESRVAKYLKEHCVVRWIQLDDDAAWIAHFAIAVLRPALNE